MEAFHRPRSTSDSRPSGGYLGVDPKRGAGLGDPGVSGRCALRRQELATLKAERPYGYGKADEF